MFIETLVFIIISIGAFFVINRLQKLVFGSIMTLNYFSLWFYLYFIFCFIGSFLILAGHASESYFIKGILVKEDIVFNGTYLILWAGIAMFLSFLSILLLISHRYERDFSWENMIHKKVKDSNFENVVIVIFFLFCLCSFVYYQIKIHPSPLLLSLKGENHLAGLRRIEVTRYLGKIANTYIVALGRLLSQILSLQLIVRNSRKIIERALKFLMILISFLFLISNGEKAPIVYYFLALYLTHYASRGKTVKINLKMVVMIFLSIFAIYFLFVSNDINQIKQLVFERVFFAQIAIVFYSLDFYNVKNFIGFSSLSGIFSKVFGITLVEPSSVVLMHNYFYEMILNGGWNMNGIYISEAWSNFGLLGVLISPIYVGVLCALFYMFLYKKNDSFYRALLFYYSASSFTFLTSFNMYIYNSDTVVILAIALFRELLLGLKRDEKNSY